MEAEKVDCDVVCCQETFKVEGNYILEDFDTPHYKERCGKRGGGVLTWIKKGIKHKLSPDLSIIEKQNYESIAVECTLGTQNLL